MRRSISLTAPGILSAYRRRCIAPGRFSRAASNPVNRSHWRLAWKVRRPAAGFFIALFPRPSGGTTLFSPEATCFSSGRKNGFVSGAPRMIIPCGRSSRWTSYGHSRRLGIRRGYKRTRGVRSPMRCVPFSPASAWEATFGIRSRILSRKESLRSEFDALLAQLRTATLAAVPSTRRCLASCSVVRGPVNTLQSSAPAFQFFAFGNVKCLDLTPTALFRPLETLVRWRIRRASCPLSRS